MLKILQARLQEHMNRGLPDVQTGFRKDRGTRDLIAKIHCIIDKAREFQENIYLCFIDYAKAFDYVKSSSVTQSCLTICDPMDCSPSDSSDHGFPRLEYWSGLPFPSPGDLPNPGIEPRSPALQADSLPTEV